MKSNRRLTVAALAVGVSVCWADPGAMFPAGAATAGIDPPTQVLVVGTIHGGHASNPNCTYDHLLSILGTLRPDAIAVEIRPEDFRRRPCLREMVMATIYGIKHKKRVYPIDWYTDQPSAREERSRLMQLPGYKDMQAKADALEAASGICMRFRESNGNDPREWMKRRGYEFFNGEDYNRYFAESYRISIEVFGDSAMNLYYETRNNRMLGLVQRAIDENRGKRLVVLTGSEHKHYFDRALASTPGVRVARLQDILPLKTVAVDPEVREFLTTNKAIVYFDTSTPSGLDAIYADALVPLVHGPDMDFSPETVPTDEKGERLADELGMPARLKDFLFKEYHAKPFVRRPPRSPQGQERVPGWRE